MIPVFLVSCHIDNFVCNPRASRLGMVNFPVRCLDKSILVDPRIAGQGVDQTDVRSFRRLNRAHPSIMRVMDIADLEPGTIP